MKDKNIQILERNIKYLMDVTAEQATLQKRTLIEVAGNFLDHITIINSDVREQAEYTLFSHRYLNDIYRGIGQRTAGMNLLSLYFIAHSFEVSMWALLSIPLCEGTVPYRIPSTIQNERISFKGLKKQFCRIMKATIEENTEQSIYKISQKLDVPYLNTFLCRGSLTSISFFLLLLHLLENSYEIFEPAKFTGRLQEKWDTHLQLCKST